ncbi:MAG: hypothetical protein J6S67_20940 [Methanobrevibacter sp.]|nr:hypothetical protein [Methanobrevibacter sp.]
MMVIEKQLAILDLVYFHVLEMNLRYYQEIYGRFTLENFTKAIVEAQKEITLMLQNKSIDDYYERIRRNAV